jgi:hypothetical protein
MAAAINTAVWAAGMPNLKTVSYSRAASRDLDAFDAVQVSAIVHTADTYADPNGATAAGVRIKVADIPTGAPAKGDVIVIDAAQFFVQSVRLDVGLGVAVLQVRK